MSTICELLKISGVNINAVDSIGGTPLHRVAKRGTYIYFYQPVVVLFCKGDPDSMAVLVLTAVPGANLAIKNKDGNTPLHIAAAHGII